MTGKLIESDLIYCKNCEKEMFLESTGGGSTVFCCHTCPCEVEVEA